MMVTIKQVSELAGVSSATVSRVINNTDTVKQKTRELVLNAMTELGYRHNTIAASLASNKTNTVGLVVPELHGSFFGSMMSGAEQVLRKANKHMFVVAGHSDDTMERNEIDALLSRRCDALILHVEAVSDEYLITLAKQNIPLVVVSRFIDAIGDKCISLDNHVGGYLATRHLLDLGHRSIACITGALFKADGVNRLAGHKSALQEAGLRPDERIIEEGNFQADSGERCMEAILAQQVPFSAVVCGNDEMATGAINVLRSHGLRVPEDISVVGYDNIDYASYLTPKLTTIDYPIKDIGQMAARWIVNQAYGDGTQSLTPVLTPKLIERGTTRSI
ncbi:LacI family DNA-binding transcriptional regulator [Alteromonas lipotrueiana]|uniref:LacI family DNA-binding transcriptional regulator n=1 Tax=Alteromonas lipotrueiana TaxID=2803815 RepID=UPI001FE4DE0A|nr:LacI family DNA-binding transcriptional regulator [Alteromonas lipotrueiana]